VYLKKIGKSAYGTVFLVKNRVDGQIYAMKILAKAPIYAQCERYSSTFKNEINIFKQLECPFLCKIHFYFETETRKYYVSDYIRGGELFYYLGNEVRYTEENIRFYSAQIICGVEYLHLIGIIYRYLQPGNILLTAEGNIKLTDFGISKQGLQCADKNFAIFCGNPEYMAPEIIMGEGYTESIDWWSLGILIFEMLTGLSPFYSKYDENEVYQNILTKELIIPNYFSQEVSDLILNLLVKNPLQRLNDPKKIKTHEWFRSIDFQELWKLKIKIPFVPKNLDVNSPMYG